LTVYLVQLDQTNQRGLKFGSSDLLHASTHPASRASFIAFLSGQETKKEALHKSALAFEVALAPNLGLVIPVYSQTGFSSASINFYEKPMVETELTGCKKNMAAKGPVKGVSGRFANESFRQRLVRQRLRSIRQRPKSLRQRPTGQFANV